MSTPVIPLLEADEIQVKILMDNAVDTLAVSTPVARRMQVDRDPARPTPRAEHGFSALIDVRRRDAQGRVLLDTGATPGGVPNNMDALNVAAETIEAIVLSHGHYDHTSGLPAIVERLGRRGTPVVLHPDARLERKLVRPDGTEIPLPLPPLADLSREDVQVLERAGPSTLAEGMLLVSGEVARVTEFEQGFRGHYARRDGEWQPDPLIHDDQCVAANLRGKGLVIVAGCSHAGIINTVRHVQRLTGVTQVHAIMGGFHLGGASDAVIASTIAGLAEIAPRHIVPMHCTGWSAIHRIANAMPDAFIPNYVGTTYLLD